MKLKARISVVICPECGLPIPAFDMCRTKLSTAECENCGKEYEIVEKKEGLEPVIRLKRIN